jgi:hypothetical protein
MSPLFTRSLVVFAAAACLTLSASAATPMPTPPIKPGLWQVTMQGMGSASASARTAERMKNMTPETRAKVDAMLKERGMSVGSDGGTRVCLNKDSLSSGAWANQARCKTDFKTQTSSAWKWHSVCTSPDSQSDGEAIFSSAESYTVNVTTTNASGTRQRSVKATWVSGDCGAMKPLSLAH